MDRSEVLTLVKISTGKDEYGMTDYTETTRNVFVNVRSISSQEFYEAGQSGIQPQYEFIMFAPDYDGELTVEYRGRRYHVYRTYIRNTDELELYCEERAGNG